MNKIETVQVIPASDWCEKMGKLYSSHSEIWFCGEMDCEECIFYSASYKSIKQLEPIVEGLNVKETDKSKQAI